MADAARYEVQRRRQIEENKRRIEELGLRHLAAAAMPPKAKQLKLKHKARAPGAAAPPRRSGRVANLPDQPDYRENVKKKIVIGPTAAERSYAIAKAKAKELEGELRADYPTFLKTVSKYYATAFSLSLPPHFCREHLPEHGKVITLVDEEDDEFDVQYYKGPNDRGYCITSWRGFATDHKLDDGDCLVFQLIQQRKFKVRS
ncbi:hypothetical protein SETIT_9G356700v2 [Setaria italica]|uniref:TF-B3 domain-containing protein n=1 Tax=Setaria italica TaxID=4555 RepID=A0A368SP64_SETIT|nr:hypothetical protein SETIT_9G356700v2 [Setaria italica]